jgi:hypothetical protein
MFPLPSLREFHKKLSYADYGWRDGTAERISATQGFPYFVLGKQLALGEGRLDFSVSLVLLGTAPMSS